MLGHWNWDIFFNANNKQNQHKSQFSFMFWSRYALHYLSIYIFSHFKSLFSSIGKQITSEDSTTYSNWYNLLIMFQGCIRKIKADRLDRNCNESLQEYLNLCFAHPVSFYSLQLYFWSILSCQRNLVLLHCLFVGV